MPSKYDEAILSESDLQAIATAQQNWKLAKEAGDSAGMQEAAAQADAIRRRNGYTGGDDGSGFTAVNSNEFYGNMINGAQDIYQRKQDAINEWGQTQQQLQQERSDFTIEQIEQNKAQAEKDYIKEQQGAYADWQKQSNAYGVNAEVMASQGMTGSGYSESSQVAMYNTYQNRVATARESFNNLKLGYDNMIKDAQLQNNAALAELAYNTLMSGLELELEAFQVNNSLLMQQRNELLSIADSVWSKDFQERQFERSILESDRDYNATLSNIAQQRGSSGDGYIDIDTGLQIDQPKGDSTDTTFLESLGFQDVEDAAWLFDSGVLQEYTDNGVTKYRFADFDTSALVGTEYEGASFNKLATALAYGYIHAIKKDNGVVKFVIRNTSGKTTLGRYTE